MAFETFAKNGQKGSRKVFSGETNGGDAMTNRNNREKREYMKSGRMENCAKAQSSEKFMLGKEAPGNTSKREYPSSTHAAKKFGTTVSQGS
tara:strand:+ start:163 stop:435 length:273 start_codon:yes stop_codon:yes gene_type:complete